MAHAFKRRFMWHILHGIEFMIPWLGKKQEGMCSANSFRKTTESMTTWKIHDGTTLLEACNKSIES
jgi:hypothetical protein